MHFAGSLILTLTFGSLNIPISPITAGGITFGCGVGWELVADQRFRDDPRGGDYYDLMWDLGGTVLGTALLNYSDQYHQRHKLTPADIQFRPMMPRTAQTTGWSKWYRADFGFPQPPKPLIIARAVPTPPDDFGTPADGSSKADAH